MIQDGTDKKPIDIEQLLQWAINAELPKGQHVMTSAATIFDRITRAANGRRSEINFEHSGGCYLPGTPHPDALVIAKALALLDAPRGLSDEADARGLLGDLANIDPLAINVCMALQVNVATLLLSRAILRDRPKVNRALPRPSPVFRRGDHRSPTILRLDGDGDLIDADVRHWRATERAAWRGMPRCPIVWGDPSVETIAEQRTEYAIWRGGLFALQDMLINARYHRLPSLRDHEPLLPAAPATPWSSPPPREPVIHSLPRSGASRLPLSPS